MVIRFKTWRCMAVLHPVSIFPPMRPQNDHRPDTAPAAWAFLASAAWSAASSIARQRNEARGGSDPPTGSAGLGGLPPESGTAEARMRIFPLKTQRWRRRDARADMKKWVKTESQPIEIM
jgi:hypothetical protein